MGRKGDSLGSLVISVLWRSYFFWVIESWSDGSFSFEKCASVKLMIPPIRHPLSSPNFALRHIRVLMNVLIKQADKLGVKVLYDLTESV